MRFTNDSLCYRPYTQGPCSLGFILINSSTCIRLPCQKGELYFPEEQRCYRIGSEGSCRKGQVVTFDFRTRPSIDGISYNGVCNCEKDSQDCTDDDLCDSGSNSNTILYKNKCYKLYTKGPCVRGAWLAPKRQKKEETWLENNRRKEGVCECMPGYVKSIRTLNNKKITECTSPTVILAEYLNNRNIFTVQSDM